MTKGGSTAYDQEANLLRVLVTDPHPTFDHKRQRLQKQGEIGEHESGITEVNA
ncbi:hypothetical protein DAERI_110132 [Deinococcus aerius]|uniref:Uncharacterized protein n=1 Tax=Deinococcus aerius TaxID=200253 RepID=A0A2I9D8R3_9DEIO|nr:hypothetical protein [Deinococcus aerius]GBF06950.1 hypothetical protein DAERI_110132 [Deinococcus aerius]